MKKESKSAVIWPRETRRYLKASRIAESDIMLLTEDERRHAYILLREVGGAFSEVRKIFDIAKDRRDKEAK